MRDSKPEDAFDHPIALRNSSTVTPAVRISARSVPGASSACCGTVRLTRTPSRVITTWLPTWPRIVQPSFRNALTASLPEMFASFPTHSPLPNRMHMRRCNAVDKGSGPRKKALDSDHDRATINREGLSRFLILCPEPGRYSFLDIGEYFLLCFALRDASRQRRAFGHDPAVFFGIQNNMKHHWKALIESPVPGCYHSTSF